MTHAPTMPVMAAPPVLPYEFDTGREVRQVLKGTLALLAVLVLGGAYMLIARHDVRGAAGTLLIDVMLVAFAMLVLRSVPTAAGRVTRDSVVACPQRAWGVALPGPVGTFPLNDFRAMRVERVFGPIGARYAARTFERATLLGRPGTPDVHVLRAPVGHATSQAEALAAALGLPCEVVRAAT